MNSDKGILHGLSQNGHIIIFMVIELQISDHAERYGIADEVKSMFTFEATVEQAEFELQLQHAVNAVQRQADLQLQRAQWQADLRRLHGFEVGVV